MPPRVLMLCLDGFDAQLADRLCAQGLMPAYQSMVERSARFALEHGAARRTGLAGEHLSTGLSPEDARRWAAVSFHPRRYVARQQGTRLLPFPARLASRCVVFDATYFDLATARGVQGVVGWGAHDPGVATQGRPSGLLDELGSRFGPYPASRWIYGLPWPVSADCHAMGAALARALYVRADAACWLLSERLPRWDLALVVAGEPHSAAEGLWHGLDPTHPLHDMPSAGAACEGLIAVYRATDALLGRLVAQFSDAALLVFSLHGMGTNRSDVPSMVLLPELLFRRSFGRPLLVEPEAWREAPGGRPLLDGAQDWTSSLRQLLPRDRRTRRRGRRRRRADEPSLDWMPAAWYQPHWPKMPAFALPSFYDGRIRINLEGRERHGRVSPARYASTCDELAALLQGCRDPRTSEAMVESIERVPGDPRRIGPTEADLVVVWRGSALGLEHDSLGRVGPFPMRRSGGHTGGDGLLLCSRAGPPPGDHGRRSAFDVVPTAIELLGEKPEGVSGHSVLAGAGAPAS